KTLDVKDVRLTEGGCCWLHGVVSINKKDPDDGKKAIDIALNAHGSMKRVIVVDSDIDIHDDRQVEWAVATRFQEDRDMVTKKEKGSSLDPSADENCITMKYGLDATKPFNDEKFDRAILD
ncbi:MAG: UbiD family decarboxylase, partial [Thermoplasmata archaeon]